MATTDNIDLNKPFKWPLSFYNSVQKGSYQMKKTVLNGKLNCFHLRVQEYIKSGRDKVVVDPDPDKIYTKQKNRLSKLPINCSPESPAPKYPSHGWGNSLERMPPFTRAEMNQ